MSAPSTVVHALQQAKPHVYTQQIVISLSVCWHLCAPAHATSVASQSVSKLSQVLQTCYTLLVAVQHVREHRAKAITGQGWGTGGVTYQAAEQRLASLMQQHRLVSRYQGDGGAFTVWLLEPEPSLH